MKITDLKCAVIGHNPVIRITTDEGISGLGVAESFKPYLKPHVMFYRDLIVGQDPTDVQRVMLRIRRMEERCAELYTHENIRGFLQ